MTTERKKKAIKGSMMWIASNNIERVKSLSELVNNLAEYDKALLSIKSPSDNVIQALKEQFNVVGSIEVLRVIDGLLLGSIDTDTQRTEPTPMAKPEYEQNDFIEVIEPQPDSTVSTPATLPESTHSAPETKQPDPTLVKPATAQTEWLEPAPIQPHPDYDGTTALKDVLEALLGKTLTSNQVAAMTNEAVTTLGIVRGADKLGRPSLIKDTPTRLRIYQWHVANKPNTKG